MNPPIFYVYEHWRPDLNLCFYVGKGKGQRAYDFNPKRRHNAHHANIVNKLHNMGMVVEIRLVASGLTESEAFSFEIGRIAFWRSSSVRLVNHTDGGQGSSDSTGAIGKKISAAKRGIKLGPHSEEHRRKISQSLMGKKRSAKAIEKSLATKATTAAQRGSYFTPEAAQRIAEATRKSLGGVPLSEEHRRKISQTWTGKKKPWQAEANRKNWTGRKHTEQTKEKMRAAKKGRILSADHKQKISEGLLKYNSGAES